MKVNFLLTWLLCLAFLFGCASSSSDILSSESDSGSGNESEERHSDPPNISSNPTLLVISIHVEGWPSEQQNSVKFNQHAAIILKMAQEAHAAGAVFSFELNSLFAMSPSAQTVVNELLALGHGVEVHADVGGVGSPSLEELTNQLSRNFRQLEALGVTPVLVSGICSKGPFVEAALSTGFLMTTGVVEYCLTSLDQQYQPEGWDIDNCLSPAECHGPPGFTIPMKASPWRTSSSASWTIPDPSGDFMIVIGESGSTVKCLAEINIVANKCQYENDDIQKYAQLAESYVLYSEEYNEDGCCVFSTTMSIGSPLPEGYISDLVRSISWLIDEGRVRWATPTQILTEYS
jgi:hypothetical protein